MNLIFSDVAELNSCVDSHAVRTGLFVNARADLIIVIIIRLISFIFAKIYLVVSSITFWLSFVFLSSKLQLRMKVAAAFLAKFQLTESEVKALRGTRDGSSISKVSLN